MYRRFLGELCSLNPKLKVVGMSATPFRLDSGLLHRGNGAIFTDVAYEASIGELVVDGYLCPLVSKLGAARADLEGVKVRGGEYVARDLEETMDTHELVAGAVDEILQLCSARDKRLLFCAGVSHAQHVCAELQSRGIEAACVTGQTSGDERERLLHDFRDGKLRAVSNVNVLTTGFDAPNIDAIVLLRPTKSTGLYCQMVGRGMRLHPSKDDTLVLDFAGNILEHGPIDRVRVDTGERESGVSTAPMRECPKCQALVFLAATSCSDCGAVFERRQKAKHQTRATEAEIMVGAVDRYQVVEVDAVSYVIHRKEGKPPSLRVNYHCGLTRYSEWVCFEHGGYAQEKAAQWWMTRSTRPTPASTALALQESMWLRQPRQIVIDTQGRYTNIVEHRELRTPAGMKAAS